MRGGFRRYAPVRRGLRRVFADPAEYKCAGHAAPSDVAEARRAIVVRARHGMLSENDG